ncbi:TerB family tellurite resistance protein [Candidatus Leptofilum sp.]|uniref:tellurite resistance TerB family protein n=1 Tax=Candidatus Leptofilum sp. TaxID=3241576 RepID=UPI003B5B9680
MSDRNLIFTLAKVIIAAAWADGEVSTEEVNSLKDLLFQLPRAGKEGGLQMSGQEWSRLEMYIDQPIGEAERARLVVDLQNALRTPRDRQLVRQALDEMVGIDGEITAEEQVLVDEVKRAIADVNLSLFMQIGRMVGGAMARRTAVADTPNRERHFEDYIKNKVFYAVSHRLHVEQSELQLPEAALRKLSLAGGLMAKVAHVDHDVSKAEFGAMVQALQTHWEVDEVTAVFITEVAVSEAAKKLDHHRTVRQFATRTTREEWLHFLDVLFAVAAADGMATYDEIEEIRAIARTLNLTREAFIEAKLKVPREKREA